MRGHPPPLPCLPAPAAAAAAPACRRCRCSRQLLLLLPPPGPAFPPPRAARLPPAASSQLPAHTPRPSMLQPKETEKNHCGPAARHHPPRQRKHERGKESTHLGCHVIHAADADDKQQLGLGLNVEAILGLGLALQADQVRLLQGYKQQPVKGRTVNGPRPCSQKSGRTAVRDTELAHNPRPPRSALLHTILPLPASAGRLSSFCAAQRGMQGLLGCWRPAPPAPAPRYLQPVFLHILLRPLEDLLASRPGLLAGLQPHRARQEVTQACCHLPALPFPSQRAIRASDQPPWRTSAAAAAFLAAQSSSRFLFLRTDSAQQHTSPPPASDGAAPLAAAGVPAQWPPWQWDGRAATHQGRPPVEPC